MYNLTDQTYSVQPKIMSDTTIKDYFNWLANYCQKNKKIRFHTILHGGEPLLAGKETIKLIGELSREINYKKKIKSTLSVLTNGILLDKEWIDLFTDYDIGFSISLDGPEEYHDRFRKDKTGVGTHSKVVSIFSYLIKNPNICPTFSNATLCVINPEMDGKKLVRYFYNLGVTKVDFLLPDQNHDFGSKCYPKPLLEKKYSKVLFDAYKEWRLIDNPNFKIRKFELLLLAHFGVPVNLDSIGLGPIKVFTIETNGIIEPVDSMKICGNGFTKSNYNINQWDEIDIEAIPLIKLGLQKDNLLIEECKNCKHLKMCGGGYLPHRFQEGNFSKTVYCSDMYDLCENIINDLSN
jgi:uncharacterized protein